MSRVAVISGGASGIGAALSRQLAAAGHAVAIFDLHESAVATQVEGLRSEGYSAAGFALDVTDRPAVDAAIAQVRSDLGAIGIAVTSAGVTAFQPFVSISAEQWNRTLSVNLTGTFNVVQAAIADMIDAGWGRIVTISSTAGQTGAPQQADYVASKGGVIAFTKALAYEFAGVGITVNTVPPSLVDTPMAQSAFEQGIAPSIADLSAMLPMKRVATSHEVAAACAFLCSEDAGYITGQQINVNGGIYM